MFRIVVKVINKLLNSFFSGQLTSEEYFRNSLSHQDRAWRWWRRFFRGIITGWLNDMPTMIGIVNMDTRSELICGAGQLICDELVTSHKVSLINCPSAEKIAIRSCWILPRLILITVKERPPKKELEICDDDASILFTTHGRTSSQTSKLLSVLRLLPVMYIPVPPDCGTVAGYEPTISDKA